MGRLNLALAGLASLALIASGCGSSSHKKNSSSASGSAPASSTSSASSSSGGNPYNYGGSSSTTATTSSSSSAGGAGQLAVMKKKLGRILVGRKGLTLYLFERDDSAKESYCNGACAKAWPPFTTTGKPNLGPGIDASLVTTFKRKDGTTQVAYAGHPLYYYAEDKDSGDAYGQGSKAFGASWYVLRPNGKKIDES